ncbi:MAG: SsrA-binding protein SmpB [Candidatus Midichloria mitochondrii]|uniref:SsrA-binding protein n=1 Tax=Midichloria mitochondrii (strain IricVA) TaxID=696127 RepID=F7XWC2_MIDMI|nr:SsrA-binding protein SmpB [Candidatus Midichloria mitochondrii]AEI88971.1 SsrA-binding protein [Candidatus Midichloria mitochondrii IricVA]MDJ1255984.1 SsrA-binding protein SmpB [Candidatus Midichloria mitochondrii]MDJ1287936.1 SsrA-binding protein SmpB [Candidatus Midichloria mitochondrii]MDJ1298513.1 SsrA-binding protein SmpB [Candidatus Midichloria mitochondrii]MDJ1312664.1 SsrA-binding protein SmpB [Candidatus Midichloria mitochondrii]
MSNLHEKNILKNISQNNRAYYDYFIEDIYEAGIVLTGTEVKSLRSGKISIAESHADEIDGEIFLLNANIPEYMEANRYNHYPKRPRKLLLHANEIRKLIGLIKRKGYTLVPIAIYFNKKNKVKVALGLGRGKKNYDKRETIKEREWQRQKSRME